MNCLITVYSYHHGNTRKVAEAIAGVVGATVKAPAEIAGNEVRAYQLLGFGAGIDSGHHYQELLDFADTLPTADGKKCFIFSTSAVQGEKKVANDHARLRHILTSKGYDVVGEFSCKGFNTNLFLKYIGGMNKGRPNAEDIGKAEQFGQELKERCERLFTAS
jgi:flavodoxin